jgi:hypothetical protein
MNARPRNPSLVPNLVAALVLAAAAGTAGYAIADRPGGAAAAPLSPELREQIDDLASERAWAGEVCGALSVWRQELGTAVDELHWDVTDPLDGLRGAYERVRAATETLVDELRDAGVPDTRAGRALADGLDELASDTGRRLERLGARLAALGDVGIGDAFSVAELVRELRGLYDDVRRGLQELRGPAGELLDVLRADADCAAFLDLLRLGR